jgi:hypothetical protein
MRIFRLTLPVFAMLLPCLSTEASAIDLSGQSATYLQSRQEFDSTRLMPLYEYLNLNADDLGSKNLSFHFGGWYRHDLRNESFGAKSTGDLQYAYLGYRADTANAFLNLGRVAVNQGVALEPVDGASAGMDLKYGFGISAFGGVPAETAFDTRTGDSVYGGRISHEVSGIYSIGVSYLRERNDKTDFRKEEGLDLWFRPFDKIELLGATLYNATTSAVARNAYNLILGPFSILTLRTEFTQIQYKDFFTSTTLSAFQLQPGGPVDPDDKLTTIGEEASLAIGALVFSGDYKKYHYLIEGNANYYGGRLAYTGSSGLGAGATAHRMDGQTDKLRYYEYRAYAYKRFGKTDVTVDLLTVTYDTEINSVKNAYSASLAGGYALTPALKVGADIEYAKNPFFEKDVRGLVKLIYNFDTGSRPRGGNYL